MPSTRNIALTLVQNDGTPAAGTVDVELMTRHAATTADVVGRHVEKYHLNTDGEAAVIVAVPDDPASTFWYKFTTPDGTVYQLHIPPGADTTFHELVDAAYPPSPGGAGFYEPHLGTPPAADHVLSSNTNDDRFWISLASIKNVDVADIGTQHGQAGYLLRVASGGGLEYRSPAQTRSDIGAEQAGSAAAVQSDLDAHKPDTTNVHGISDTSVLASTTQVAQVQANLDGHEAATTSVHGIADTSKLATGSDVAGVQSDLDAHEAATADVHGIPDATDLATQTALDAHVTDVTSVHGIADTSVLATDSDVVEVQAHLDTHESSVAEHTDWPPMDGNANKFVSVNQDGDGLVYRDVASKSTLAILYKWALNNQPTDPGSRYSKANNDDLTIATRLYVSKTDRNEGNASLVLSAVNVGDTISISSETDADMILGEVLGVADNTTWVDFEISNDYGIGTFDAFQDVTLELIRYIPTAHNDLSQRDATDSHPSSAIVGLDSAQATQDGRLDDLETNDATQDGRLTAAEGVNTTQDGRLDAIETLNTTQDGRLDGHDTAIGQNTSDIDQNAGDIVAHVGAANIHFEDVLTDGVEYVRKDGAWVAPDGLANHIADGVHDELSVASGNLTVDASGNTQIGGTLDVVGAATMKSNVALDADIVIQDGGSDVGFIGPTVDGVAMAYSTDGTYDQNDGGIAAKAGQIELHGSVVHIAALAAASAGKAMELRIIDGNIFAVDLPTPAWVVTDTDTGVYDLGAGAGVGPWVQLTGLQVTVPQDIVPGERIETTVVVYGSETGGRSGTIAIDIGIDGAEPTGTPFVVAASAGFEGAIPLTLVDYSLDLPAGTVAGLWARRESGEQAQFNPDIDGSLGTHTMTVAKA